MKRYRAAGLCFLSELIHLWLLPGQYEVFVGYGIIFLLIAMTQGFIGVSLLFEPRRRLITFGLWINGLTAFLYIFTHTFGVLVGEALLPLSVDAFGVVATVAEVLVVGFLFMMRRDFPVQRKRRSKLLQTKMQK